MLYEVITRTSIYQQRLIKTSNTGAIMPTINEVQVKNLAKNIKLLVDSNKSIKLSQAQEIIARQLGYKDYNALASYFKQQTVITSYSIHYTKLYEILFSLVCKLFLVKVWRDGAGKPRSSFYWINKNRTLV